MRVVFSLPPPTTGQTLVNRSLLTQFEAVVPGITTHNISQGTYRGFGYHLHRIQRVLSASGQLAVSSEKTVFFSSESGLGALYLLLLFLIARMRGKRIFFHHQVYSYLVESSFIHNFLMKLSGDACNHILLSPLMAEDFKARFGDDRRCTTLHNAIFIDQALRRGRNTSREDTAELRVGFLGRLETSKGIDDFLAIVERLADDQRLRFIVGGDHKESDYAAAVERLRQRLGPRLDLRGFVSGDAKVQFFEDIDVLVFPSKYRHEASPMVCYEALAMSVPVLATRVGAVADIVTDTCGKVFERDANVIERLTTQLRTYADDRAMLNAQQEAARQHFSLLEERGERELAALQQAVMDAPRSVEVRAT